MPIRKGVAGCRSRAVDLWPEGPLGGEEENMSVIFRCPIVAISSFWLKSDEEMRFERVSDTEADALPVARREYKDEVLEDVR